MVNLPGYSMNVIGAVAAMVHVNHIDSTSAISIKLRDEL